MGGRKKIDFDLVVLRSKYERGVTVRELAVEYGCSPFPILRALHAAGTAFRYGIPMTRKRPDIKAEAVVALYAQGWPKNRIAKALGCSGHLVTKLLRQAGVPERPRAKGRVKCRFCAKWVDPKGVASHERMKHPDQTLASRIENGEG